MVRRGSVSLKYLAIAASNAVAPSSRAFRVETVACTCTSTATMSSSIAMSSPSAVAARHEHAGVGICRVERLDPCGAGLETGPLVDRALVGHLAEFHRGRLGQDHLPRDSIRASGGLCRQTIEQVFRPSSN